MTIKIDEIRYDEHDLMDAWRAGNNAGDGFALGSIDDAPQAAVESTNTMTHQGDLTPDGAVVASDHGRVIVVCDSNGPWAVDVTEMFDAYGSLLAE
jgi:hypothetical protein